MPRLKKYKSFKISGMIHNINEDDSNENEENLIQEIAKRSGYCMLRNPPLSEKIISSLIDNKTVTCIELKIFTEFEDDYFKKMHDGFIKNIKKLSDNYTLIQIRIEVGNSLSWDNHQLKINDAIDQIIKRNAAIHLIRTRDSVSKALDSAKNIVTAEEAQIALHHFKSAIKKIKSSLDALSEETSDSAHLIRKELNEKFVQCDDAMHFFMINYLDNQYYATPEKEKYTISSLMAHCKILMDEDGYLYTHFLNNLFNKRFDFLLYDALHRSNDLYTKPLTAFEPMPYQSRLALLIQVITNWNVEKEDAHYYFLWMINLAEKLLVEFKTPKDVMSFFEKIHGGHEQIKLLCDLVLLEKNHPGINDMLRQALMIPNYLFLDLSNLQLTDESVKKILSIVEQFPNYHTPSLPINNLTGKHDFGIEYVKVNKKNPFLNDFYTHQNALILNDNPNIGQSTLEWLSTQTIFKDIGLAGCKTNDNDIEGILKNPTILKLDLSRNNITHASDEYIAKSTNLHYINLDENPIDSINAIKLFKDTSLCHVILPKAADDKLFKEALLNVLTDNLFLIHPTKPKHNDLFQAKPDVRKPIEQYYLQINEHSTEREKADERRRLSSLRQKLSCSDHDEMGGLIFQCVKPPVTTDSEIYERDRRNQDLRLRVTQHMANEVISNPQLYNQEELVSVKKRLNKAIEGIKQKHKKDEKNKPLSQQTLSFLNSFFTPDYLSALLQKFTEQAAKIDCLITANALEQSPEQTSTITNLNMRS